MSAGQPPVQQGGSAPSTVNGEGVGRAGENTSNNASHNLPPATPQQSLRDRITTNSPNTDPNHADPGRVGSNTQTNVTATGPRDDRRIASTNAASSTPRTVYVNDLQNEDETYDLGHLEFFYEKLQTNGNGSKA